MLARRASRKWGIDHYVEQASDVCPHVSPKKIAIALRAGCQLFTISEGSVLGVLCTSAVSVQRDAFRSLGTLSLLLVAIGLTLGGCSKSPVKLNPVHGQVFFKDQPLEGAQIVFQPAGGATKELPMAYGTASADGSYSLDTHPYGSGAVAGDYVVFITSYGLDPKDPEKKVSKLPAKYADQANPLLKATVKEGKNDLDPFRLK